MARVGIQANELAERIGVEPSAVSNWLAGKNTAKGKNLRKLAEVLGVSLTWLDTGEDDYSATSLKEKPPESESELWKRRALAAESKLAQLRTGLRVLTAVSTDSPLPNSITPDEAQSIVDEIEELAQQNLPPAGVTSPGATAPQPGASPDSKK